MLALLAAWAAYELCQLFKTPVPSSDTNSTTSITPPDLDSEPEIEKTLATSRSRIPVSAPTPSSQRTATPQALTKIQGNLPPDLVDIEPFVDDEPPEVEAAFTDFRLPSAPLPSQPGQWVAPGTVVEIAGTSIQAGMIYVGTSLTTAHGGIDPCLVDPTRKVAAHEDDTELRTSFWPSYDRLSPTARRAYLNWLAGGRCNPGAEPSVVLLFFYGLERRVLIDARSDPQAKAELSVIAVELRRLLDLYGRTHATFKQYATSLLNWISLMVPGDKSLRQFARMPALDKQLPAPLHLALGQAALHGIPIPGALALTWVRSDPFITLRASATRYPTQFETLFLQQYASMAGEGLVLPKQLTKLKISYRPASQAFKDCDVTMDLGDVPQESAMTASLQALQVVADTAAQQIEGYSRYVAKNPDSAGALEALLLLPLPAWPANALQALAQLKTRLVNGTLVLPLQDLLKQLGAQTDFNKDRLQALARTLQLVGLGVEPDILGGAKCPKPEEPIALFDLHSPTHPDGDSPSASAYQTAQLALQVISATCSLDAPAQALLRTRILEWPDLESAQRLRLHAHLHLLSTAPVSPNSLRKRLEPMDAAQRQAMASLAVAVVQAQGNASAEAIKALEKAYKLLGLDTNRVYTDVHAAAATGKAHSSPARPNTDANEGFLLDTTRIAALQQDSARVSALLTPIFAEEETVASGSAAPLQSATAPDTGSALPGLDEAHAALATLLLTRPQWQREELLAVAATHDLMLDGALERINEVAFDVYDMPFTEGEDPVEVNPEIRERLVA